jgi:hypothetical protein
LDRWEELTDDGPPSIPDRAEDMDPERLRLEDPLTNTRERTYRKNGDEIDLIERRRHADKDAYYYVPISPSMRQAFKPVKISGDAEAVQDPTLVKGPTGAPMAAYTRKTKDDHRVVDVVLIGTDKRWSFGTGLETVRQPNLIPGDGKVELTYLEGHLIKKVTIDNNLQVSEPVILAADVGMDGPLRVKRRMNPKLILVARMNNTLALFDEKTGRSTPLPGLSGDVGVTPDDRLVIVYKDTDNAIYKYYGKDAPPVRLSPASWHIGPPFLIKTTQGLRLMFHRYASDTPPGETSGTHFRNYIDGKWGPLELAFHIEEPVDQAIVSVEFSLPWPKAHYKPMNTWVYLNNVKIGSLLNRVPSGRFTFPVAPQRLKLWSTAGKHPGDNVVTIHTQDIGPGKFHLVDKFKIYTSHSVIQDMVVAGSRAEANRLSSLSSVNIRHNVPDLVLNANYWEPPRYARPGETLKATIGFVNTGDIPIHGGELVARMGESVLGSATVGEILPYLPGKVDMSITLPENWDIQETLTFEVSCAIDTDPAQENNRLTFGIFGKPDPKLEGPKAPAKIIPEKIVKTKENSEPRKDIIEVELGKEIPLNPAIRWYIVPVKTGRLVVDIMSQSGMQDDILPVIFNQRGEILTEETNSIARDDAFIMVRLHIPPAITIEEGTKLSVHWSTE